MVCIAIMQPITATGSAGSTVSSGSTSSVALTSASQASLPSTHQQPRTASTFLTSKAEREAARNWDIFYKKNETRFFKDRHWTDREFEQDLKLDAVAGAENGKHKLGRKEGDEEEETAEELIHATLTDVKGKGRERAPVLLEVGCGVGNMIYPVRRLPFLPLPILKLTYT